MLPRRKKKRIHGTASAADEVDVNEPAAKRKPAQRIPLASRHDISKAHCTSQEVAVLSTPREEIPGAGLTRGHYDTLRIHRGASLQEVRRAYKACALRAHPDKGGDNESMHAVKQAFECLSDPRLRFEYDALLEAGQNEWIGRDGLPPEDLAAGSVAGAAVRSQATAKEAPAAETESALWRKSCVVARQMMEDCRVGMPVLLSTATTMQCVCLRQMLVEGPDVAFLKNADLSRSTSADCLGTVSSFKGKVAISRRSRENKYELSTGTGGMEIYTQQTASLEIALDYQIALAVLHVALDHDQPFHQAINETFTMAPTIRLYFRCRIGTRWGPTTMNWRLAFEQLQTFREIRLTKKDPVGNNAIMTSHKLTAIEEVQKEKLDWTKRRQSLLEAVDSEMPKRTWASEMQVGELERNLEESKKQLDLASEQIREACEKARSRFAGHYLQEALQLDVAASVKAAIKLRRLPESEVAKRVASLLEPMEQPKLQACRGKALPVPEAPKRSDSAEPSSVPPQRPERLSKVLPPLAEISWLPKWPLDVSRMILMWLDSFELCCVQATSRGVNQHCSELLWRRCRNFDFSGDPAKRSFKGRILKPSNSSAASYSRWFGILRKGSLSSAVECLDLRSAPEQLFHDKEFRLFLRRLSALRTVVLHQTRWRSWNSRTSFVRGLPDNVKAEFVQ
eukprot:TRINITY_DN67314_c0_g1_i1.p1 TRINITY_DN67314_c0_g1~~TRINITY_DN67314_c0_g1_i1.p1  ORF type:complete len:680 (-),score=100.53 TRINITY_DN67314_c0_g1_i1:149-2188(-)